MLGAPSGEDNHNLQFQNLAFRICQNRYGNPHYYATLFSVDDLIPVYSGGKFRRYSNEPTYSRPTSNWHHLLNGLCAVRVLYFDWCFINFNNLLTIRHLLSIIDRQKVLRSIISGIARRNDILLRKSRKRWFGQLRNMPQLAGEPSDQNTKRGLNRVIL